MKKNRKTIGLEADFVELLKGIAKRRGMSIAAYLRKLIEEVARIEEMGYFAPRALSERRAELVLSRFSFVHVPVDVLNENISEEELEEKGVLMGKALVELEINPQEVIELLGLENQIIVSQGENIILIPQFEPLKRRLSILLRGIAKGSGLQVIDTGNVTVILPRGVAKQWGSGFMPVGTK